MINSKLYFSAYRDHWGRIRSQGQMLWKGLTLRERWVVAGSGLLLGALASWLLLIQPALKKLEYWQTEIPKLQAQAQALEEVLQGITVSTLAGHEQQTLQQSLRHRNLEGFYQLQAPDAAQPPIWVIRFDDAPADAAMRWLLDSLQPLSLEIIEARLQRDVLPAPENSPSTLSGIVRLTQAPSAKET